MSKSVVPDGRVKRPLIEIRDLKKWFSVRRGIREFFQRRGSNYIRAVDGVSITINKGEILGLAGESGSGKTTLGEIMVRLQEPTSGEIIFENFNFSEMDRRQMRDFRKNVTMIFQNPYESFNPRHTISQSVGEPLQIHHKDLSEEEMERETGDILERVGLRPPERFLNKYPHEMSGGELQRASIARSMILGPSLIIADEPVSMLDVSTRAGILQLLKNLRDETGVSILYISHDLATIKYMSDVTAIMYLGNICEVGPTERVLSNPEHPYTRALLMAVPVPDPEVKREDLEIRGEIPHLIDLPPGCKFQTRCPMVEEVCMEKDVKLQEIEPGHRVACHFTGQLSS